MVKIALNIMVTNFHFNGDHYLQVSVTSMGTKMAPAYANVFIGKFEDNFIYTYHSNCSVEVLHR